MIRDDVLDILGYGIAPYVMDDEFPTIELDLGKRTVGGMPFDEFVALNSPT